MFKTKDQKPIRMKEMDDGVIDASKPETLPRTNKASEPTSMETSLIDNAELGGSYQDNSHSDSSRSKRTQSKEAALYFLTNSKVISISMTLVLGLAGSLWLCAKNSNKELLMRKYTSRAEMSEFDQKFITASAQWHQAIKIAETMSDKRKVLGDLHLRAASAEWQAALNERSVMSSRLRQEKTIPFDVYEARVDAHVKPYNDEELADLQQALSIYEKIPNTKADQVAIIDKLKPILANRIPEFERALPDLSYLVSSSNNVPLHKAETAKNQAIQDMLAKKPTLGLASFNEYLRETSSSDDLLDEVVNFASTLRPDESSVQHDLVPIMYEIVYYCQSKPSRVLAANYWLDNALETLDSNANTFESRRLKADTNYDARNYHAALIEYHRCLGFKYDREVQQKLIKTLQLCRMQEDPANRNALAEYIALLTKSKTLDLGAYGIENPRTQQDISHLGIAYAAVNQFEDALRQLLLAERSTTANSQSNAFNLADVYAKEGNSEQALQWYQRGKDLEKKERSFDSPGIWGRMAFVYIRAGRMREAETYINLAESERTSDSFGSNSFGTLHQPMME